MNIHILTTGGTIDKDYPHANKGWAFEIGEPYIRDSLTHWNPNLSWNIEHVLQKDSLEITDEDRSLLLNSILNAESDHIIITHGTDTIMETAQYLEEKNLQKIIVITGAMKPGRFKNSDADQQIGGCIALCQALRPGVYLFIQGLLATPSHISRDDHSGLYFCTE